MTEKKAIILATFLGMVLLVVLLTVCRPFSWGREHERVTEEAVSGSAVSSVAVSEEKRGTKVSYTSSGGAVAWEQTELDLSDTASGSAIAPGAKENAGEGNILLTRFPAPESYTRVAVEQSSLGAFLRTYPLKKDGTKVKLFGH